MSEVQSVREEFDLEKLKQQWLEDEPFFGDVGIKSRIMSPYAHLSFEERLSFLNTIRTEYESSVIEYLNSDDPPELESKLERFTFKIIDDTMNYLLFIIDATQNSRKSPKQFKELSVISNKFGIKSVYDIMKKPENVCNCLYSMIREITYVVRVPKEDIKKYYGLFSEEKNRRDQRNMWVGLLEKQKQNPDLTFPIVGVSGSNFKNRIEYWNSRDLSVLGAGSEGYPYCDEEYLITGILKSIPANNEASISKYRAKPRSDDPAYN